MLLPINVTGLHWYLDVINANKREVQMLDSLGKMFGRADLNKTRSITHVIGNNIYIYILEPVYMMVWRYGGTYSWIY